MGGGAVIFAAGLEVREVANEGGGQLDNIEGARSNTDTNDVM